MANPFPSKFDGSCKNCGSQIYAGDDVYSHAGMFICDVCAAEADAICECGNYKKPEYKKCFGCKDIDRIAPVEQKDAWDPWAEPKMPKTEQEKKDELPF